MAKVPSFRFFITSFHFFYPRSRLLGSRNTGFCTVVPVLGVQGTSAKTTLLETPPPLQAPPPDWSWRVQGNPLPTLRQPCVNPSPTFRQPFANLLFQPLSKFLLLWAPKLPVEKRMRDDGLYPRSRILGVQEHLPKGGSFLTYSWSFFAYS